MDIPGFICAQRGECCRRKQVPVTLADIARIAEYLDLPAELIMNNHIFFDVVDGEAMLFLEKGQDGWCLFNTGDRRCRIHPARPSACALYICDTSLKSREGYPWPLLFDNPAGLAFVVARSIAHEVTRDYALRNQDRWNENDFAAGIAEIRRRAEEIRNIQLRAARHEDGTSSIVTFDCNVCGTRVTCCNDRPVTLDDLRALAQYLEMSMEQLFESHVAKEVREHAMGILSFVSEEAGHCCFLDAEARRCSIAEAQPKHCRLAPCPLLMKDDEMVERYFLGAGSLRQQFRHSIAMAVTRRYVAEFGAFYHRHHVEHSLALIDRLVADPAQFEDFRRAIAPFRYEQEEGGNLPKSHECDTP